MCLGMWELRLGKVVVGHGNIWAQRGPGLQKKEMNVAMREGAWPQSPLLRQPHRLLNKCGLVPFSWTYGSVGQAAEVSHGISEARP